MVRSRTHICMYIRIYEARLYWHMYTASLASVIDCSSNATDGCVSLRPTFRQVPVPISSKAPSGVPLVELIGDRRCSVYAPLRRRRRKQSRSCGAYQSPRTVQGTAEWWPTATFRLHRYIEAAIADCSGCGETAPTSASSFCRYSAVELV